jgi:MYXO-CTERM domain-containing protein
MWRYGILGGVVGFLAFSSTAYADDAWSAELPKSGIYGGQPTEQCGWPSVAFLGTGGAACTGALVHPEIVLTAAHCVPNNATASVRFGERSDTAVQLAQTEYCRANPGFTGQTGTGTDYGFCKLATPVTNVPIIPIAFGCEESVLAPGREIVHVGFGVDENGQGGRKKSVAVTVQSITNSGEIISGTQTTGICSGDSGGPAFIRLSSALGGDDTWRVIGIHSWAQMQTQGVCNGSGGSIIASKAVDFIWQQSGINVLPCHGTDGDWAPTWACQGFPIEPWIGGESSYQGGCDTGPLGDFSAVCGPPLTDFPDDTPPTLVVVEPRGDVEVEVEAGGTAGVRVHAEADDGDGWGVAGVELVIVPEDGEEVSQVLEYAPYVWNTTFPAGAYNIKLIASDYAGNVTESEWIGIGIGTPPPSGNPDDPDEDEATDDGTGGDDAASGGETSSGDEPSLDDDAGGGCSCRSVDSGAPWSSLLVLALLGLRRRRSAR